MFIAFQTFKMETGQVKKIAPDLTTKWNNFIIRFKISLLLETHESKCNAQMLENTVYYRFKTQFVLAIY